MTQNQLSNSSQQANRPAGSDAPIEIRKKQQIEEPAEQKDEKDEKSEEAQKLAEEQRKRLMNIAKKLFK